MSFEATAVMDEETASAILTIPIYFTQVTSDRDGEHHQILTLQHVDDTMAQGILEAATQQAEIVQEGESSIILEAHEQQEQQIIEEGLVDEDDVDEQKLAQTFAENRRGRAAAAKTPEQRKRGGGGAGKNQDAYLELLQQMRKDAIKVNSTYERQGERMLALIGEAIKCIENDE